MALAKWRVSVLFDRLAKEGQQLADIEQRKFAIVRDEVDVYKLRAIDDLSKPQRAGIVKRIKPRTQTGENRNAKEQTQ